MAGDADVGRLPTVLQSGDHGGAGDRLTAGATAGEYVIERFLGGGGMGEVYAGRHPVIDKKVAVKVIKRALAASPEAVARFTREARAVNQVDHANVVDVFALGRLDDGRLYLVMDLVEGESLRARVARGALAPAEALAVLEPIAAALDAAHAKGVVHRDLKPDNVMVSGPPDRPTIKVLDFGIAKLVSSVATEDGKAAVANATLTGQGTWLGTPAYMAPEQWSADGAVPASDRYAFAVMTYELLAGAPPFTAASVPALMEKHFRAEIPAVSVSRGGGATLPPAIDAVLARGMAKDPAARYPSATAIVDALRAALGTQLGAPPRRAAATAAGGGPRSLGTLPLVAGAVGLAVLAGGAWIVSRGRPASAGDDRLAAAKGATAEVLSSPPGATVVVNGEEIGVTPKRLDLEPGAMIEIEVRKPGYLAQKRTVAAGAVVELALQPIDGFQGTWALPGGELRRFVRQGDDVVALRLAAASENGTYYRRFHFVASTGAVVSFAAEEEHVDPRAPDEPTCRIPLQAQYDYDTGGDELELRKERIKLDVVNGRCIVAEQGWGEPLVLTRIDRAADTGTWAESRAGGGPGVVAGDDDSNADLVDNPAFQPREPLADEAQVDAGEDKGNSPPPVVDKPSKPTRPSKPRPGKTGKAAKPVTSAASPDQLKKLEEQKLLEAAKQAAANRDKQAAPPPQAQTKNPAADDTAQVQQPAPIQNKGGKGQGMSQIAPQPAGGKASPDTEGAVDLEQQKATPQKK